MRYLVRFIDPADGGITLASRGGSYADTVTWAEREVADARDCGIPDVTYTILSPTGRQDPDPYVPDFVRLADEVAGLQGDARREYWRRRAPLGDAELYLAVVPFDPDLRAELEILIRQYRMAFAAGKRLTARHRDVVRTILRSHRARVRAGSATPSAQAA